MRIQIPGNTVREPRFGADTDLMVALGCLSGVIASFPPKTLNLQEVDVMTTFYCDRLEDETSTKENIMGLTALQNMSGFGEEEVTRVCNAYHSPLISLMWEFVSRR